jgi:hypothetical protein
MTYTVDSQGDETWPFPLLQLASHPGASRSELLALRWTSVDLAGATVSIASRRARVGYEMVHRPGTKTAAGARVVDLDPTTEVGARPVGALSAGPAVGYGRHHRSIRRRRSDR